jgi:repressor LexA
MPHPLSKKQVEVLKALENFSRTRGYIPSVRELASRLRKSPTTVFQHLKALEKKGYIQSDGTAHGWQIVPMDPEVGENSVRVNVAGVISAGVPIEAVEDHDESYVLPKELVPDDAFALRVRGNSMVEDHILEGDIVIVRPQDRIRDGDVAVALLEDGSATLKRVFRERNRVRLQPANSAMKPFYARSVRIQGKVVGVWRACS